MIKAIFIDFDWTLFDHKTHNFIPSCVESLNEVRKKGIKVFINSARTYYSLKGLNTFDYFKFDGFVTANGGCCFLEDKEFYINHFSKEIKDNLIKILDDNKINYLLSTKYTSYLRVYDKDLMDEFYSIFYETRAIDISNYKNEDVVSIQVFNKDLNKDELFNDANNVIFNRFSPLAFELTPKEFKKSEGIAELIKYFNYSKDELMAFGDDINDIDMFKCVKYGICMGNGKDEVKPYAYYVTSNIEDDGIYNALKYFKLI